jgi:hypothetical protein
MKILMKLMLVVFVLSLFSAFSVASAQNLTPDNTASPTSVNLNAVYTVNNKTGTSNSLTNLDAWAVGDGGTIIRWNGSRWSTVGGVTTMNLYSVVMADTYDGWAVGGSASTGVILRWNGTWSIWNKINFGNNINATDSINATLYSVTVDSTGNSGWAVGANGISLYWNGSVWNGQASMASNTLRGVAMVHGSNLAWAVGDGGKIFQWNGNAWTSVTSPTTMNLNSIVMVTDSSGWIVGGSSNSGVILNLNNSIWNIWNRINFGGQVNPTYGYVTDTINNTLNSISMDTASSAWAVGGNGVTVRWNGTEWRGQGSLVTNNLRGVSMLHGTSDANNQAWAVGDGGKILAWSGAHWIPEFPVIAIPLLLSIIAVAAFLTKSRVNKKPRSIPLFS